MHHVLEHVDAHAALLVHVLGNKGHRHVHHWCDRNAVGLTCLDKDPLILEIKVLALARKGGHGGQAAVQAPELQPVPRCEQRPGEAGRGRGLEAPAPPVDGADESCERDENKSRCHGVEPTSGHELGERNAIDARRHHNVAEIGEHVNLEGTSPVVRLPHQPRHGGQTIQVRPAKVREASKPHPGVFVAAACPEEEEDPPVEYQRLQHGCEQKAECQHQHCAGGP
mmetsp:Transcript_56576/g.91574  ORF Transcript_56576/g.91574 Transcript_56576/m.91574 type:complete len:225 (+) Transcript_56576:457-1131(+)